MEKLKLLYTADKKDFLEGYDLYHKLYRQKAVYIKAAIFLIPLLLFIQQICMDPYFYMGYLCIIVCTAAIVCIILTPNMERRTTERALENISGRKYQFTLYEDRLTVERVYPEGEEPAAKIMSTEISLGEKSLKLIETETVVGIFTKAESVVLPKREMNDYDLETIRKYIK